MTLAWPSHVLNINQLNLVSVSKNVSCAKASSFEKPDAVMGACRVNAIKLSPKTFFCRVGSMNRVFFAHLSVLVGNKKTLPSLQYLGTIWHWR
ncbi:MAG: hypothetical protein ABFS56_32880 [Pseudomonadota bacterium]